MSLRTLLKKPSSKEVAAYFVAVILCLFILGALYRLKNSDLSVPFIYDGGDATYHAMVIKAIITNGWYLTNPSLGAPGVMEMHDFPMPDTVSFLFVRFLGLLNTDFAWVQNMFFLLTFPATTICSFYVLRRFGISRASAALASLLYAFTNFHILRSEGHMTYSTYYHVPLLVMVMLWVCSGELSLFNAEGKFVKSVLRTPKFICALLISMLVASAGGVYYFFFGSVLLLSAGLYSAVRDKRAGNLALPVILAALMFGTFLINISPNLLYIYKNGKLSTVAIRNRGEGEIYGLKIAQLLLPIDQHRVKTLARIKDKYNNSAPLINENHDSSLGLIGGVGFLTLIGWLLYRRSFKSSEESNQTSVLFDHLSLLNITAVLVATIGGFGSVFNNLVSPQIRGYNRMSVYIAFFSLFTVALLLDSLRRKYAHIRFRGIASYGSITLLIVLGVLDQTPKTVLPDFNQTKAEFRSDKAFVSRIESAMPPKAMIFQLPVCSFPEGEFFYDNFRGYFHSDSLRWSFGATRDRQSDKWQKLVAAKPAKGMLDAIALADFKGIYINRRLYNDGGAGVESELSTLLGSQPIVSDNQKLSFFSIVEFQKKLEEYYGANLQARREQILNPLVVSFRKGCTGPESLNDRIWYWCGNKGEIQIENSMSKPREVALDMSLYVEGEGNFKIESDILRDNLRLKGLVPVRKQFSIPPGKHSILFTCDAPRINAPLDPRTLVVRIDNFKLTDAIAELYETKESIEQLQGNGK